MTEAEHPLYDAGDDFSVYDKKKAAPPASSWNPFSGGKATRHEEPATPTSPVSMVANPYNAHHVQQMAREPSTSAVLDDFGAVYGGGGAAAPPPPAASAWSPFASKPRPPAPGDDDVVMTSNPNSSHLVAREPSSSALLDEFDAVYEKKRAPDEPRSWNPFASAKKAPPPKRRESHSADVDDEPLSPATFANNPFSLRQQAADAGGPELTADGVYGSRDPASPAHMTANPFGAAHRKKTVDDDPTDFGDAYEKDDAAVGGENPFGAAHRKKKVKDDPTDFGDTYEKDDGAVGGENPFGAAHRKKKEQDDPTDFGGAYATDGDVAMTANPFAATHDQRKESAVPPRRGTDFHNSKADSVAMRLGKQRHKVRKSTTLQKQDVHVATADVYGEGDGGVAGANPIEADAQSPPSARGLQGARRERRRGRPGGAGRGAGPAAARRGAGRRGPRRARRRGAF